MIEDALNILAADIGGTNARFALVEISPGQGVRAKARRTYSSAELRGPREAVQGFLEEIGDHRVDLVSVAVAGPVTRGVAVLTNLDWCLRETDLAEWVDTRDARVMNDFQALGHAVPLLGREDLTVVQAGAGHASGPIALIGAGTGLGQALIVPGPEGSVQIHSSEGGHSTFAARNETEWALRRFLAERHGGHVSWERVLSGSGLRAVYDFIIASGRHPEDSATRDAMGDVDPAAVVVERALLRSDAACVAALDIVLSAYGARVGDAALSSGAIGGVYLAGGITLRIREQLGRRAFLSAFLDKGRMSGWLESVPVRVIERDDAGLMGAALAVAPARLRRHVVRLPSIGAGN